MDPDLALLADEGMNEEGLAIMDETHHSMQEAMATIERGCRTLREARAKQHEVRLSRKYYKTSTTSRPSSFGARDDSKLTCLKCGRIGHGAANCPDKDKPQDGPGASLAEEQAPFVCYAEAEAFAGQVSGAPNTQMAMRAEGHPGWRRHEVDRQCHGPGGPDGHQLPQARREPPRVA